jgi:membrane-associated phospholipid phosphatase
VTPDRRRRRLAVALVASLVFTALAVDVAHRGDQGLLRTLDQRVRATMRTVADDSALRSDARLLSRLTGEGLVALVGVAALLLWVSGRRPESSILVLGTLSAWIGSLALKVALGVPRPRSSGLGKPGHPGFPSGHAFVTLVACGLIAWALGRHRPRAMRIALYTLAAVVAGLTAAARVIVDAHWLSDAVGGLVIGIGWLNVAVVVAEDRLVGRP